jgi:hypothetical protein
VPDDLSIECNDECSPCQSNPNVEQLTRTSLTPTRLSDSRSVYVGLPTDDYTACKRNKRNIIAMTTVTPLRVLLKICATFVEPITSESCACEESRRHAAEDATCTERSLDLIISVVVFSHALDRYLGNNPLKFNMKKLHNHRDWND